MRASDGDECHGPLLPAGHCQDEAQCDINRSPSPLLEHYPQEYQAWAQAAIQCQVIHALRMRVERTFAWEDTFKRLLLRFERIQAAAGMA